MRSHKPKRHIYTGISTNLRYFSQSKYTRIWEYLEYDQKNPKLWKWENLNFTQNRQKVYFMHPKTPMTSNLNFKGPKKSLFTLFKVQKSPKRYGNIFPGRFWKLRMSQTLKIYTPYYCVCSYLTFSIFSLMFRLCNMVQNLSGEKFGTILVILHPENFTNF